ncbi:MAG: PASTA domain-containing protein [Turicibacter sp.]
MSNNNNKDFFSTFLNNESNEAPKVTPNEAPPTVESPIQSNTNTEHSVTEGSVNESPIEKPSIKMDFTQPITPTPTVSAPETQKKSSGVTMKTDEKYERFVNPNKKRNEIIAIGCGVIAVLGIVLFMIFGNKVEVPDFSSYTPSQIAAWGSKNNMLMLYTEEYNNEVEKGKLIQQDIAAGKKVKKGSDLTLLMSLGIDPEVVVDFPTFDNTWTYDSISTWIEENKLINATLKTLSDEDVEKDHFIKMDIDKNITEFKRKTKVTFYVSTGSPFMVDMIDLSKKTEAEINTWAQKNGVAVVFEKVAHDTIAEGQAISQSIETSTSFNPKKETLTIQISTGPGITVPNLAAMSVEEIKTWATTNVVTLIMTEKYHNTVSANTIIESDIKTGDIIKKGDLINMTMSLGKVGVTNFIGNTEVEFMTWVDEQNKKGAGITPNITYQYTDTAEKNKIMAQSIYDRRVDTGATIQVVVNLGGHLTIPDLLGLNEWDARARCEENGLVCVFNYDYSNTEDGKVASQDRQAGFNASSGDIINVVISKGPKQ